MEQYNTCLWDQPRNKSVIKRNSYITPFCTRRHFLLSDHKKHAFHMLIINRKQPRENL